MRSRTLIPPPVATVAATALLAAGCGGGSPTTAGTTPSDGLVAYAHCMRSHGVPDFPDPVRGQGIPKDRIPVGNPQFSAASGACQPLMPASGLGPPQAARQPRTQLADMLSFARCMRGHGVLRFPDPSADGQLTIEMVQAQGIDVRAPAFLQDAEGCLPASHGALTLARVRAVISRAGG